MNNPNTDIVSAKRTIDKEVEALRMMEDELNDNLTKALDIMQKTKCQPLYLNFFHLFSYHELSTLYPHPFHITYPHFVDKNQLGTGDFQKSPVPN